MAKRPTVIITGANGFVGSYLTKHFQSKGWQVIGLVRGSQPTKASNISYAQYTLGEPFDESIFKNADYLIHTAYVKYDRKHPQAVEQNITGAKQLLAASRKFGLTKNIFMSSMSAHSEAVSKSKNYLTHAAT